MKRIPFGKPQRREPLSIAGGVATGGEIFAAAGEQMRLVENTTAAGDALTDAYESWRADIKAGTGQEPPPNPMLVPMADSSPFGVPEFSDLLTGAGTKRRTAFQQWVNEQAARFPAEATKSWAQRSPEQDARALARQADSKLGELMDSHPGWDKFVSAFGGGGLASLRDPLTVGTLFLGGGPGAAKTIAGRILTVAAREALLNAGTEAAAQPIVQAWRQQAGLDAGFDVALANTLFAAGFGGVFGAGGRGLYEGVAAIAGNPKISEAARRAAAGDPVAAGAILGEIRDVLPAEARGALDAQEQMAVLDVQQALADSSRRRQEELLADAERRARRAADVPFTPRLDDEEQIARLTNALAPAPESIRQKPGFTPAPDRNFDALIAELRGDAQPAVPKTMKRPVARFLRGSIHPQSALAGDLKSRGVSPTTFPGLFSNKGRKALDNLPLQEVLDALPELRGRIREDGNGYALEGDLVDALEAEAGQVRAESMHALDAERQYYERQGVDFSTPDPELKKQLAAVADAERRYAAAGENDLGLESDEFVHLPPGLARREYTAQTVRAILREHPGIDDDTVKAAVNLHLVEGETLPDAIDFAQSLKAGVRKTLPPGAFEELGSEPPEPAGLDDPGNFGDADAAEKIDIEAELEALAEAGFSGDVLVPFGDELVSLEQLQEQLAASAWLESVVEACKT